MQRYRQIEQAAETNSGAFYPKHTVYPTRGIGTDKVNDRYKTSKPSYAIPNSGYPFSHIDSQELWQKPYIQPLQSITVSLKQPYGSRYRVAGIGSSPNKIVVLQNPTGPIMPTERGFRTAENIARMGSFQATMDAASVARRRRGQ